MNNEEVLFELKPCHQCPHSCVEGQRGVKCPFDKIVEDCQKEILIDFFVDPKYIRIFN